MENPTKDKIKAALTPRMRKLYDDDTFVVVIYKAFPYIQSLLEEGQRSRVSEANMETIAPVLLAINFDLKLIELFADKGKERYEALEGERQQQRDNPTD